MDECEVPGRLCALKNVNGHSDMQDHKGSVLKERRNKKPHPSWVWEIAIMFLLRKNFGLWCEMTILLLSRHKGDELLKVRPGYCSFFSKTRNWETVQTKPHLHLHGGERARVTVTLDSSKYEEKEQKSMFSRFTVKFYTSPSAACFKKW